MGVELSGDWEGHSFRKIVGEPTESLTMMGESRKVPCGVSRFYQDVDGNIFRLNFNFEDESVNGWSELIAIPTREEEKAN